MEFYSVTSNPHQRIVLEARYKNHRAVHGPAGCLYDSVAGTRIGGSAANSGAREVIWEAYNPGLHRRSLELDRLTPG